MKKILALLLTLCLAAVCFTAMAAPAYNVEVAKQSVVRLLVTYRVTDEAYPDIQGARGWATGSGFFVGDINDPNVQYIVTAGHVVMHNLYSGDVNTERAEITLPSGQTIYPKVTVDEIDVLWNDVTSFTLANVEKYSTEADVAVIKLNGSTNIRKPAVLLDKKNFGSSDVLHAMGFPSSAEMNLADTVSDQLLAGTENVVVQTGSFSAWSGNATTHMGDQIVTSANMDHGVSGGPLVDENGYVVGVCVAGSTSANNYAVATDEVLKLLGSITEVKYTVGPLQQGLSTTMIIIIAAAVVVIAVLLGLILAGNGKKNSRSLELKGSMGGKTVPLKKGVPVVVGRDPNRCQIIYPKDAAGVSSVHCTITFDGKEVTVADNGSSYGTFVGGQKVEPGRPMVMHRGQEVTFGSDKNSAALH